MTAPTGVDCVDLLDREIRCLHGIHLATLDFAEASTKQANGLRTLIEDRIERLQEIREKVAEVCGVDQPTAN